MLKTKALLFVVVLLLLLVAGGTLQAKPTLQDGRYFPETGFTVDNDVIWDYFQSRGGVDTFGYPVSDLFSYRGFDVQIFQRHVLQINGEQARPLNLLDPDVMPINTFGGLTFPEYDQTLAASAPAPDVANYGEAVGQHLEANVPETWQDQPVGFLSYYLSAAPAGGLRTLLALEVWGFPTSQPKADPNNENFIYQGFQRGIMHYDATNQVTRGILLGDAFKQMIGTDTEPIDDFPSGSSDQTLPLVDSDYEAMPTADLARQELSAFWVQDLHGSYAATVNFKRGVTLIDLTSAQESTINSEGLVDEVVLSDEFIAWTSSEDSEDPISSLYEMPLYYISVLNRATGEQKRITEAVAPSYSYLAIDGTRLVWADRRNEMDINYYDTDIYGYDLATDTEYAIAVAPGSQQQPSIHGDLVVWQDNRNSEQRSTEQSRCGNCPDNQFDLYLYDFKDGSSGPIVEEQGNNNQPQIWGNRVAWVLYRENKNGDLYLLELDSGEIRRITQTAFPEGTPILSEDRLLWTVKQTCDVMQGLVVPTGVYVWDFKTDKLQKLTSYREPSALLDKNTVIISEVCIAKNDIYTIVLE